MRHGTEPLRRNYGSYERSFGLILFMGWERELNSRRSNPPLFLSSSVVERSAVNWLVVGSNPTWGDFIDSEICNSEWMGSLWPLRRVDNSFFPCLCFYCILSHRITFCSTIPLRRKERAYLSLIALRPLSRSWFSYPQGESKGPSPFGRLWARRDPNPRHHGS